MTDYNTLVKAARDSEEYAADATFMTFTEEIERALNERNWTREDLAIRLGVSLTYLDYLMRGQVRVSLHSMSKIAYVLGFQCSVVFSPRL